MKKRKSFVSRNIGMDLLVYHLDRIPFMTSNSGFVPIVSYCNNILSKANLKYVNDITRTFPLITLGLDSNGREKNLGELVDQYMTSTIKYGNLKSSKMDDDELDGLVHIYIYLMLPKITTKTYELLSEKYCRDNMEKLMLSMKLKIEESKLEYQDAYNEALFWSSKLPREILEKIKIKEKYIREKYKSSVVYLENSMKIIDRCLVNNSKVRH